MAGRTQGQVDTAVAFWDTSALVPLCVSHSLTPRAMGLYENYEVAVWWGTPVEIARSLTQLSRMQRISTRQLAAARRLAVNLAQVWWVVQPSIVLRIHAATLAGQFDLRSSEALQLAAALAWCEYRPEGRVFLTADSRLRDAAMRCGFEAGLL